MGEEVSSVSHSEISWVLDSSLGDYLWSSDTRLRGAKLRIKCPWFGNLSRAASMPWAPMPLRNHDLSTIT